MDPVYTTTVKVSGGRAGRARSEDGVLDLELSVPKGLGGGGGSGTNPEQLFAAGYAACFESSLRAVASQKKISISDSSITATVGIGPIASGGFGLSVVLDVFLDGPDKSQAQELVDIAHGTMCPYSNAVRGNVGVKVNVSTA
ncbi:organic hydroperoxide resistance protein [Aquibium sp. LZ166]|uniref:Organic hydroperoxide resistance protein n=1 Tax=Aquibium pacificus TaxID=3153579 RepID=A0ABV3SKI8_9HYPH